MINYNRLGYEIKRDLANFSEKISNGLKRPQSKFLLHLRKPLTDFQEICLPLRKRKRL